MASSSIVICNSALIKIGSKPIQSLEDGTTESDLCKIRYEECRRTLLSMYPWSFAKKRVALPALTSPTPPFGYAKYFQVPSDLIGIVVEDEDFDGLDFRWEGDYFLADYSTLNIVYLYDNVTVEHYDSLFVEALAWYLASDLAPTLTDSSQLVNRADTGFRTALAKAKTRNAQQLSARVLKAEEWLDSRLQAQGRIVRPVGQ